MKILAELGNVNIVSDPSVRGEISLSLKEVPIADAVELVTRATGLAYRHVGNTLVVGLPDRFKSGFDHIETRIFKLDYASPEDMKDALDVYKRQSQQTAGSLQGATAPSVQPEGLRDPLPQVTTECKQETPMTFAAKKKGVFVPDWPIRPREDKKDINGSVEITDFVPETLPPVPTTQPLSLIHI